MSFELSLLYQPTCTLALYNFIFLTVGSLAMDIFYFSPEIAIGDGPKNCWIRVKSKVKKTSTLRFFKLNIYSNKGRDDRFRW